VEGLNTEGEAWSSSSPSAMFKDHGSAEMQGVFEDRLGAHGLSLHEVAVLAATLESFVHVETVERLHSAFRVLGLRHTDEHLKESEVVRGLDTYMLMYVLGLNHSTVTGTEVNQQWAVLDDVYPTWIETQKWIHEVRKEVLGESPESRTAFGTTVRAVEEIAERYGRWQDKECGQLKDSLMKMEQSGTGRVSLATFYEAALNGQWQFSESKAYLQQLGALDETDPSNPRVMIANYVLSPANCVAASKFYSVCCINECEELLGHIELKVAAPTAPASRIAEIVEQLPSATLDAPRILPASLRERLDQIATHHGGEVPFHGRLFNQWLHHAYPRECPYPHLSGVSKPLTPEKWVQATGLEEAADEQTMRWHIEEIQNNRVREQALDNELPWSAEEELFISHPREEGRVVEEKSSASTVVRGVMLVVLACTMAVTLTRTASQAREGVFSTSEQKVSV